MTPARGDPGSERRPPLPFGVRAVTITADADLEWAERPDPVPGDYDLLVAVGAAGLNGADLIQRIGFYPPPAGIPEDIPGLEMAGEVVAVGARTSRFGVGDRVMALVGGAAQAELALTDERTALQVPDELDLEAAGAFMEAAATAFDALFTQAGLGAGERLLVTGAAGGVGTCAVQLGEAAGATVIASTRHRELNNDLVELGAVAAVLPAQYAEFGPFDVILELVGGPGLAESVASLATGGRLVVIGVGAGSRSRARAARAHAEAGTHHGVDHAGSPARGPRARHIGARAQGSASRRVRQAHRADRWRRIRCRTRWRPISVSPQARSSGRSCF